MNPHALSTEGAVDVKKRRTLPVSAKMRITTGPVILARDLENPANAADLVLLAHRIGSSRRSSFEQPVVRLAAHWFQKHLRAR